MEKVSVKMLIGDKENKILLCIAFCLCVIAFWNVYKCGFVYDDNKQIVQNPLIKSAAMLPRALMSDVWAFKGGSGANSNYWRPTFVGWMFVNYKAFGEEPLGWHISNLALHLLSLFLGFVAMLKLGIQKYVAGFAMFLFAVHPTKAESVTWVAGSTDLLMACFIFGSLILFSDYVVTNQVKSIVLSAVCFLFALMSKEVCLMFPFSIIVISKFAFEKTLKESIKLSVPYFCAAMIFFVARHLVLGSSTMGYPDSPSLASTILSAPIIFAFYLQSVFYPVSPSVLYEVKAIGLSDIGTSGYLLSLLTTAIAISVMVYFGKKSRFVAMGFWMFILMLLPAFMLKVFKGDDLVHDRYLYLPVLGIAVAIGAILSFYLKEREETLNRKLVSVGAVIGLGLAALTMMQNKNWISDVALWEQATRVAPNHPGAYTELAESLRLDHQFQSSREAINKAIELGSKRSNTPVVSGLLYKDSGDLGRAREEFKLATKQYPYYLIGWEQLLDVTMQMGELETALAVCKDAEKAMPGLKPLFRVVSGMINFQMGNRPAALESLMSVRSELARNSDPRVVHGLFLIGELQRDKGDNQGALESYQEFLSATKGFQDEKTMQMRNQSEQFIQMLKGN